MRRTSYLRLRLVLGILIVILLPWCLIIILLPYCLFHALLFLHLLILDDLRLAIIRKGKVF